MSPSDPYSTTAVDGSMDGSPTQSFTAPTSSTSTDPSTQRTANATLTTERITTFLADTSLTPPIVSPYPGYLDRKNTIASRCRAATDAIASFDEVFNCAHRIENKDEEGNNEKESQQQKQTKSNNGRDEK